MKQKCECGQDSNVTYIYQKKGRTGEWVAVGHYCKYCGKWTPEKKIKLSQGLNTKESLSKGERKKV